MLGILLLLVICITLGIILWATKKAKKAGKILLLIGLSGIGFIIWVLLYELIYWEFEFEYIILSLFAILILVGLVSLGTLFFGVIGKPQIKIPLLIISITCVIFLIGLFGQQVSAEEISSVALIGGGL